MASTWDGDMFPPQARGWTGIANEVTVDRWPRSFPPQARGWTWSAKAQLLFRVPFPPQARGWTSYTDLSLLKVSYGVSPAGAGMDPR